MFLFRAIFSVLAMAALSSASAAPEGSLSSDAAAAFNAILKPHDARRSLQDTSSLDACLGDPLSKSIECAVQNCADTADVDMPEPDLDNANNCGDVNTELCSAGGSLKAYYDSCPACEAEYEAYASCVFDGLLEGHCPAGIANCNKAYSGAASSLRVGAVALAGGLAAAFLV